ncbi:peptidoglycan-binding domain-containing protein [Paracoccus sp. MBLB3053]|uniref:Peptidoglycan-binding domain-containing protein n=1 Tax=Paracoccus aurantius TaxID=3073814 RepID=A0ABU2HUL7_9RHOB|nr:peptidoglycan-binding domain-containing protein [Paracoccus sp. MBLB3053]MDS9468225.1 peptidoglycan-binding domain-containing protein [Paracoccus sp. MBLB3053]
MRSVFIGLPVLAILLSTAATSAVSQVATVPAAAVDINALDKELKEIDREISAAEDDLKNYEGGLLVALVQARIETLKLTRAIMQNRIAAERGDTVTKVTLPIRTLDPERAKEISEEIEKQNQVIAQAEADTANAGGLVGALAISRVLTEKLTLAGLRGALMEAKYGSVLPVDVAAVPPPAAHQATPQATVPSGSSNLASAAPEWADPEHPDIDYSAEVFASLHNEGFKMHGWWAVLESKAEIDDSPRIFAVNASAYEKHGFMTSFPKLTISCREGEASAIYDTDEFIVGDFSSDTLRTTIRIDDQTAQTSGWSKLTSSKGSGLFGGKAQALMRDLIDAKKIFIRLEEQKNHDETFTLAGIEPVAEKVAAACGFSLLDLTKEDYRAIQTMLNAAGFDAGLPDGVWGTGSAKALRAWQEQNGLPATGAPDRATLTAIGH